MKKNKKKLLLLSSVGTGDGGVGSLFLNDFIKSEAIGSYYWYIERPFFIGSTLNLLGKYGFFIVKILANFRILQTLRLLFFIRFLLPKKVKKIKGMMRNGNYDFVVLTTSSPELISIGRNLTENGVKVLVIVWDDPQYLVQNLNIGKTTCSKLVLDDFETLLKNAQKVAVISEGMRERYLENIGIDSLIIRHGIQPIKINPVKLSSNNIRIVFAGSLYSKVEWNAFIEALELSEWKVAERSIELFFIGDFPVKDAKKPEKMKLLPRKPQEEVLKTLSEMDIGYLPYWFDKSYELVAKTSFPGKMSAYTAAGLKIFHHGPEFTTVTKFLSEYQYGKACNSIEPEAILVTLNFLITQLDNDVSGKARNRAMREKLSLNAMHKCIEEYVNL